MQEIAQETTDKNREQLIEQSAIAAAELDALIKASPSRHTGSWGARISDRLAWVRKALRIVERDAGTIAANVRTWEEPKGASVLDQYQSMWLTQRLLARLERDLTETLHELHGAKLRADYSLAEAERYMARDERHS
jgi:hypothetical protein